MSGVFRRLCRGHVDFLQLEAHASFSRQTILSNLTKAKHAAAAKPMPVHATTSRGSAMPAAIFAVRIRSSGDEPMEPDRRGGNPSGVRTQSRTATFEENE